jgi:hypothetical protein
MRSSISSKIAVAVVALFVAAWCAPSLVQAQGGPIKRLSAQFLNFDTTETLTSTGVCVPVAGPCGAFSSNGANPGDDGALVYTNTVLTDDTVNTLYVTITAVGDDHFGAAEWLSCRIDGAPCNPGQGGADFAPPGWLSVVKYFNYDTTYTTPDGTSGNTAGDGGGGTGDQHDNNFTYTWCTPILPGTHTVDIRQATSDASNVNNIVYFEAAHVFIDASSTPKGCQAFAPVG